MITFLIPRRCPTLHLHADLTCSIHDIAESPLRPWKLLANYEGESKPAIRILSISCNRSNPLTLGDGFRYWSRTRLLNTRLQSELDQFLDPGEASCLALAISRRMTLVTDDLAARRLAEKREVSLSGTLGILIALVRHNAFSLKEANSHVDGNDPAKIPVTCRSPR